MLQLDDVIIIYNIADNGAVIMT